jgi:predicted PolB exonuclease-like 3'-5' exonuclease
MKTMVFDIETVPDVESGRRILNLEGLPDAEVAKAMTFHRLQETGSDFLPLHLQRIVAISVVWRHRDGLKAMSLGTAESSEQELVTRFFEAIERHAPELVSWNGSGFDLPVLHYRSLLHGIQAPRYWETGDNEQAFRYNNYLSRFHWRHIDLMDVLSGFQGRSRASLNDIATMLGLPGKLGFSGDMVWDHYQRGEIEAIRNYCETDVMNTWLVLPPLPVSARPVRCAGAGRRTCACPAFARCFGCAALEGLRRCMDAARCGDSRTGG